MMNYQPVTRLLRTAFGDKFKETEKTVSEKYGKNIVGVFLNREGVISNYILSDGTILDCHLYMKNSLTVEE